MTRPADPIDRHALATDLLALAEKIDRDGGVAVDPCVSDAYRDAARLVREAPTLPAPAPAPAWRKEPPTADEVRTHRHFWFRECDGGDELPIALGVYDGKVKFSAGSIEASELRGEWAPCVPPGAPAPLDRDHAIEVAARAAHAAYRAEHPRLHAPETCLPDEYGYYACNGCCDGLMREWDALTAAQQDTFRASVRPIVDALLAVLQ